MAANAAVLESPPKTERPPTVAPSPAPPPKDDTQGIPIGKISPLGNIRDVSAIEIEPLVDSVKLHGVLLPILVVPLSGYAPDKRAKFDPKGVGFEYRTVAGFRRLAAATKAGLKTVPARVLAADEREILEVQLVENLERQDLSPIEEASAFKAYLDTGGSGSQSVLAKRIGRQPSYVSNRLRLLALPAPVRNLVDEGSLSSSHAEVLLRIPSTEPKTIVDAAARAVKQKTSVVDLNRTVSRYVEELEEERRFKEKISKLKHPTCPTCKAPATRTEYHGLLEHQDQWSPRHMWNGSTGKTYEEMEREREKISRRPVSSAPSSRPKPKPVDCTESPLLRSAHDPMAIVQAALKQGGKIELVEYQPSSAVHGVAAVLRIGLAAKPLGGAHVVARPVEYSTGERTQLVVQDAQGSARRTSKSLVSAFEKKALPALKLRPGKPATFDAEQLKGTADTVNGRLAKLRSNPEALELARSAEAKGKHRAAVLDFLDEALLGRGHASYGSYGGDRRL